MIFLVSLSRRFFSFLLLGCFHFYYDPKRKPSKNQPEICGKSWHVPDRKARMMVWWRFGDWTQSQRIGRMLGRLGSRKRGEAVPVRWGEENVFFFNLRWWWVELWGIIFCRCLRKIFKKSLVKFPVFYCNVRVTVSTFASFHSGTVHWLQAPHDTGYGCGLGSWTICHCFLGLQCGYVGSEDRSLGISPKKRGYQLREVKMTERFMRLFFIGWGNLKEKTYGCFLK